MREHMDGHIYPVKVSVGVPVYNGDKYLGDALNALLSQSFLDFELIVSDNASTDQTQRICREFAAKDNRVNYYRQPVNLPAVKNFNWVFKQSRGQYFLWAAHDDLWDPDYLAKCVARLDSEKEAILCMTDAQLIDADARMYSMLSNSFETVGLNIRGRIRLLFDRGSACLAMYGLMRSSALSKTKLFRDTWYPDFCLLFELSLRGAFTRIPESLFFYREFRKKRDKGLLHTMQSICNPHTRAPRYPFTGLYLFTQAWCVLYQIVLENEMSAGMRILLLSEVTSLYWRVWCLGISREHKLKLFYFNDNHDRIGVVVSGFFYILFQPSILFDRDVVCIMLKSFLGVHVSSFLLKIKKTMVDPILSNVKSSKKCTRDRYD